ncbi:MAG TPA: tetratricopeptide repeat protein [Streptomyces sp.]|uniref:tetratricopeptide repeat protein n=1 Tax=Streptomyces sp. TaxID=1931 RepID=UPI002CFDCFF1|nr:tetratricopeptide repeat protein [Streptomyces sp.]HWU09642.1 tetratricopeptide repeat protein [Streptomyces sp.]
MRRERFDERDLEAWTGAMSDHVRMGPVRSTEEGLQRVARLRTRVRQSPEPWLAWQQLAWALNDLLHWDLLNHEMPGLGGVSDSEGLDEEERAALCREQTRALRHAGIAPEELALALWRQGYIEQARQELEHALLWASEDADLLALWGTFLCDQGDREAGLEQLRAAVELAPDRARYQVRLGLFAQGQERLEALRAVERLEPEHSCLCEALRGQDELAEAAPAAEQVDRDEHRHFLWWLMDPLRAAEHEAVLRAWLELAPLDQECAEHLYRKLSYQMQWTGDYFGVAEWWDQPLWREPGGHDGCVPSQPYVDLGRSLVLRGHAAQAEHVLRRGLTVHPDDPTVRTELASAAMAEGRHADAEQQLRAAITHSRLQDPHLSHRHRLLGEVLLCLARPAAAAVVLRRATTLDPMNAAAHTALAEALESLRCFDDAIATARRAVALGPDQGWMSGVLGRILLGRADVAGACEALEAAARLDPNNAVIQEDLAELWRVAGPDAPAGAGLAAARRCLDLGPKQLSGYEALAAALHDLGRGAEVLQVAAETVQRWPASGRAHNLHALALWETGDHIGAIAAATEAAHLDRSAVHLHNWAWLLARTGRPVQALALYEAAQDKNPYDPQVSHGFALAQLLAGRPGAARVRFTRSLSQRADPDTAGRIHLYLAALSGWDSDRYLHLSAARWARSHPGQPNVWSGPADRVREQAVTSDIANLCLSGLQSVSGALADRIAADPERPALQWAVGQLGLISPAQLLSAP